MVHLPTGDETVAQSIASLDALARQFPNTAIAAAATDIRTVIEAERHQTSPAMWGMLLPVGAGGAIWKGLVWYEIIGLVGLVTIAAVIIILAVSTSRKSKRNGAAEKLARAASDQGYKNAEFQCLSDYRLCCQAEDTRLCLALFALCVCKQIVPLTPGSKK